MLEVSMINVSIDSEQAFEDDFDDIDKVLGELNSKLTRKDFLVVQLVFNPSHQKVNILSCTHFQGSLHIMSICPKVFILGSS